MDVAIVTVVVLALVSVTMAWKARSRRLAAALKVSGGRRALAMNLFGRR